MDLRKFILPIFTSAEKVLLYLIQTSSSLLSKVIVDFCFHPGFTCIATFDYKAKRRTARRPIGAGMHAKYQENQEEAITLIARELGVIGDEMNFKRKFKIKEMSRSRKLVEFCVFHFSL